MSLAHDPHQAIPTGAVPRRVVAFRGLDAGVPEEDRDILHQDPGQQEFHGEGVAQAVAVEICDLRRGRDGLQPVAPELRRGGGRALARPEEVRSVDRQAGQRRHDRRGQIHLDQFAGLAAAQGEQGAIEPLPREVVCPPQVRKSTA